MPSERRSKNAQLQALIREQEKDRESRHVFPERINPPKRLKLFSHLSLRQSSCLILTCGLTHREIANVMGISIHTVRSYLRIARQRQKK